MSKVLQFTLNVYVNVFVLAQTGWAPLPHVYPTTGRATPAGRSSRQGLTASMHTLGTAGLQETMRCLWEQLCTKFLLPCLMKLTPPITQQALDYSEPIIGCIYRGMGVPVFE